MDYSEKRIRSFFIGLLVISLLLKLIGIWNVSSPDEYIEVIEALRVGSGHLNFERWIKRVYLYIIAFEYGIYFIIQLIIGQIQSSADFASKVIRDMQPLLIIARVTSVIFSTVTLVGVFKIGKRIHSSLCGLISCFFLIITPIVFEMAHYARVDSTLTFLTTFAMLFIIKSYQDYKRFDFIVAGIFTGLAFQCKIQSVVLFIPFVTMYVFHEKQFFYKIFSQKRAWYYAAGLFIGWIIGNPAVLFAFSKYISHFVLLKGVFTDPLNMEISTHIGYVSYFFDIARQMGLFLFVLLLVSLSSVLVWKKRDEKFIVFSFICLFYLLLGSSRHMVSTSYMLPLYPFFYLVISIFIIDILSEISIFNRIKIILLGVIVLSLSIIPAVRTAQYKISILGPNTRILAKKWIELNIPTNSRILMDSGKNFNTFAPLIAENEIALNRLLNKTEDDIKTDNIRKLSGLISKQGLVMYEMLLKTVPDIAYDITSTHRGLNLKTIEYYKNNNFDYAIISQDVASVFNTEGGKKLYPDSAAFYKKIPKELTLIKKISPGKYNSGDIFYIYKFPNRQAQFK